jgi:hypothetical protein
MKSSVRKDLGNYLLSKDKKLKYKKKLFLPIFGRETWSLTKREEHRLRAFENRVFRRISRPERDDVTGW